MKMAGSHSKQALRAAAGIEGAIGVNPVSSGMNSKGESGAI